MGIRALPTEVRSALRTGLIITNTSQCVFELVLNSLDAGATSVAIRVDLIAHKLQVVDNGCGMDSHTLDLVGLRYMTSKCHSLEDLRKPLGKFGFRGEALASLRNVSRLLMIESREADNIATFCKVFREGKALEAVVSNTQRPSRGTTVTVQDFLYNMPVRQHRIKDALNLEEIKGLIEATALTHPQVSFSLRNDVNGSIILQTFKTNDTLKTFSYLFGHEISQSLIHVKHSSGNFKIYGYISNQAHFQKNLQFIYVNKRLVNRTKLHKFVASLLVKSFIFRTNGWRKNRNLRSNANGNWLDYSPAPKRETFPVYLLNIKCAYTEYDVSFDPKKSLLEFINWDSVLQCLEEVIETFLAENQLNNVDNTHPENVRDKSADAPDLNKIVEIAKERALGLVECVLSADSTKQSRDDGGKKIIRGFPAYRQDKQEMIDGGHDPSDKRNQILHTERSHISDIKCLTKSELEPKTKTHDMNSQLIPVNPWVEDPLTPSPAINAKRVSVNTSISKHESTFLSEDPMVYSDNEQESICVKYNDNHRHSSNNEKGIIVKSGPHLPIEAGQDLCYKSMFPLPLFPINKNNDDYIGLRDIMRRELRRTLIERLCRTQQKHGLRDKTPKQNVLKIIERKFTVNRNCTIQSKTYKNNITKRSTGTVVSKTSDGLEVIQSPYFAFMPVVVNSQTRNDPVQCVQSPYFAKALPQPDNRSMEQISNNSNPPPIVQSPYFKSLASRSKAPKATVNTLQLRNCHQTLQTGNALNFASRPTESKRYSTARCIRLPENASFSRVVERRPPVDLPTQENYCSKQYTTQTRNCVSHPNEHTVNHVGNYVSKCELPSSRHTCTHFLRQSDIPRYCPSRPSTLFKPKRNYMTSADLICTFDTVMRNYSSPPGMSSVEEYVPSRSPTYGRRTVTWGNVQYHSVDDCSHSHDRSDTPSNASCSSRSSVSYGDPDNNKWQSSQRNVHTSHHVVGDVDESRTPDSVHRRVEECRHSPSSHDGDNELSTETDWSSSHTDTVRARNNRLEFRSMRDDVSAGNGRSSSQYNLKCPSTCVAPAKYEHEQENGGYKPQCYDSVVRTSHRHSPPKIKFNRLFSFSTPKVGIHKPSSATREPAEEEHIPTLIGRKRERGNYVDDNIVSKKPRWESSVIKKGRVEDSTERICHNGTKTEVHMSTDSEVVRSDPSVGNTVSERSSGEDFLAHLLQEKPLKCNPNRQVLDNSGHLAACDVVQQITPNEVRKGCQLMDAIHVSEAGHEEVSITINTSLEAALNVDKDQPSHSTERKQVSVCNMDTDRPAHSEDTRLQQPDESASDHLEWSRRLDAEGNTIFVHSRTGMTSFEGPVTSNGEDPYSMTSRFDFIPKGMSPILKEKAVMTTTSVWNPGAVGNDELSTVKWRDDLPKCEDLIKQLVQHAEKRMAFCEPAIPNVSVQDRTAVGVDHLLTSYSFTKNVFTCLEVLGQLDSKFIVTLVSVESEENPHLLVLFDQHAVDERIRLEHLVEDYLAISPDTQFKTTPIESPIVVNLSAQELRIVSSYEKEFQRIGLRFDAPTETGLKVTSVPSCLKARATLLGTSVEALVKGHASAIVSGGGVGPRIPNTLQTVINSEACRGAIKFGDALSMEACRSMLTRLSECALPFQCAHGRPSLVPLADMRQIQAQQQQRTKVETKPNYQHLRAHLKGFSLLSRKINHL